MKFHFFPAQVPSCISNMTYFSTFWTADNQKGKRSFCAGMSRNLPSEIWKSYLSLQDGKVKCSRCSWVPSRNALRFEEQGVKKHAETNPSSDETQLTEAPTPLPEPKRPKINVHLEHSFTKMEQDRAENRLGFFIIHS